MTSRGPSALARERVPGESGGRWSAGNAFTKASSARRKPWQSSLIKRTAQHGGVARKRSGAIYVSLAIAGQPQNDRNDLPGYYSNHMRYDAQIDAYLRTNHWQNEENANQDHHPVWL